MHIWSAGKLNRYEEQKGETKAEKKNKRKNKKIKQTKLGDKFPRKTKPAEIPLENDEEKMDMELKKLAQKYRNYDRFYNMEEIKKKRDEAISKLRII